MKPSFIIPVFNEENTLQVLKDFIEGFYREARGNR